MRFGTLYWCMVQKTKQLPLNSSLVTMNGRSQSQRIWGSSDLSANLSRTRTLSFSNRNRSGSSVHPPLPTIHSRPESRAADSRPQSRTGFRDQERPLDRPKSGVRPLSGRVFMRRSSERGWIAKAYPEAYQAISQTELEIMEDDDISDCDSFFDDDFDTDTRDEKLGLLLSCNTLGVESKGRRPDWIAGEVDIPRFHCPRCRDHWYGLTNVPCDEELARLRREGLWPLGKDGQGKSLNAHSGGRTLRPMSSHKEYSALSRGSSAAKLPKIRHKKDGEDADKLSRGGGSEIDLNRKKKKRITFKLGDESQPGSSGPSGVSLDGDDLLGGKGQRSKDKFGNGHGLGGELETGRGVGQGSGMGIGMGDGTGTGNKGVGSRGGICDDGSRSGITSGGYESGLLDGLGADADLLHKGAKDQSYTGTFGAGKDGTDTSANGVGKSGAGGKCDGNGTGHGNKNADGDLSSSSQVSKAGTGSRRGSLAMSDHGKNVRKGVGYMRAVSPTSSGWGDPHHGRSFISSTATSRTGSTSNLLRDLEREKDEEPTSKSLPAIVPQIKKKPPIDFSDLLGGFQLTRAWTFSYHNKM